MGSVLQRGALVVVALLVLGWLGVLYRDRRVGQDAADAIFYRPELPRAEFERQLDRLREARLMDPDRYWDLTRARYLLLRDRPRRALHAAEEIVGDEPDNLEAWLVVYQAAELVDSSRSGEAIDRIRQLNPRLLRGSARG
ncbi:MAG TPA: hypothetical protein VNC17_20310 [Thermoleophilaceae bacterium]|nr:hypothetical protein [Thermoleophilaceae bacterium]